MSCIADFVGHGSLSQPDALAQAALPPADRWADAESEAAAILQFNRSAAPAKRIGSVCLRTSRQPAPEHGKPHAITWLLAGSRRPRGSSPGTRPIPPRWNLHARCRVRRVHQPLASPSLAYAGKSHAVHVRAAGTQSPAGLNGGRTDRSRLESQMVLKFYSFQKQDGWLPHGMPPEPEPASSGSTPYPTRTSTPGARRHWRITCMKPATTASWMS